jgi:hypothetical protein
VASVDADPGMGMGGAEGGGAVNPALDPNAMFAALFPLAQGAAQEKLAMSKMARESMGLDLKEKRRASLRRTKSLDRGQAAFAQRQAMNRAGERDVAETQAITGRGPTRMSTVGMQTFATPDALKMTGAQRARFLPNEAGMSSAPTVTDINRARADALSGAQMETDRERRRQGLA